MSLPILPSHRAFGDADLVRLFHRTEVEWCRQIAEETVLDCGTGFTNPQLGNVHDANQVLDASLAEGMAPADALAEVEAHYRGRGARCWKWVLNPALPSDRTEPLGAHLANAGHTPGAYDIMYLGGQPAGVIEEVGDLRIIPARASYRHARQLYEEASSRWQEPQLVEAGMLHLEDPQTDSVLALKDGVAAALVSVLTVGEIGRIEDVFVAERFRGQGIGRTMMSRALEICARSLFKHVFLSCEAGNAPAIALYTKLGFRRLAPFTAYRADQERP